MSGGVRVVSAIPLLGMAALATWDVLHNSDWTEVVLPFGSQYRADVSAACVLAVICWAGGLGLLTPTSVGLWLGRLGAAALLVLGVYVGWDNVVTYDGPESWRGTAMMFAVPVAALLIATGIWILIALRPSADGRATAAPPSGPEA